MRLVIDLDEKYKNLFLQVAKAAKATVIIEEPDFWTELPEHVKAGVEKSLKQAESGQTKSFEEVKKILATDEFKDHFY
ncbi:MAG: hypothetical protein JWR54_68 [Mucilaginibacter sp.]|nr:hypothetical protein [Mucilaginibacter sp.]